MMRCISPIILKVNPEILSMIRKDCKLRYSLEGATHKAWVYKEVDHFLFNNKNMVFYNTDIETSLVSLCRRVLPVLPEPDLLHPIWKLAFRTSEDMARKAIKYYKGHLLSHNEIDMFINKHYCGNKRKMYLSANMKLKDGYKIVRKDADLFYFNKKELKEFKPDSKKRLCRGIQARMPQSVSINNPPVFLVSNFDKKNIEEIIYKGCFSNKHDTVQDVFKELNPKQRGFKLYEKCSSMTGERYIVMMDASNFDGHVNYDNLRLEKNFWIKCYKFLGVSSDDFNRKFEMQMLNRGGARFGKGFFKYSMKGNRCSGDWNTASGNCVLVLCFLISIMKYLKIPEKNFRIFCDGDDCGVCVNKEFLDLFLINCEKLFLIFGHEIKIEKPVNFLDFEKIEFCQSKPILIDDKYRFVRSFKVFENYFRNERWFRDEHTFRSYMYTVGLADCSLYYSCPVIWFLARQMVHASGLSGPPDLSVLKESYRHQVWLKQNLAGSDCISKQSCEKEYPCLIEPNISPQTRLSYQKAFGYDPAQQVALEKTIKSINFSKIRW